MNNIAILVTGQPRCIKLVGRLWSEYWIDTEIANTNKSNVKIFVSTSNEARTKFKGMDGINKFGKNLNSSKRTHNINDLKNSIFACDKISINTDEEIVKQINLLFPSWPEEKTSKDTGSNIWDLGMGSVLYQLWHIYNASQLAFQYEKTHNLKFDLFVKIRIDHIPLMSKEVQERLKNKISLFDIFIDYLDRVPDWKSKKIGFLSYFNFFTEQGYSHWWSKNLDDINNVRYCNDIMFALSRNSMITMIEKFKTSQRLISEITVFPRCFFSKHLTGTELDKDEFNYLRSSNDLKIRMLYVALDVPSMLSVFEQTWLKEFYVQNIKEKVNKWVDKMWPIYVRRLRSSTTSLPGGKQRPDRFYIPDKNSYVTEICSNIGNYNMFPMKIKSSEALHTIFFRLSIDHVYVLPLNEISKYLANRVPIDEENRFFKQFNWNEKDISKKIAMFYKWNKQWEYDRK